MGLTSTLGVSHEAWLIVLQARVLLSASQICRFLVSACIFFQVSNVSKTYCDILVTFRIYHDYATLVFLLHASTYRKDY